MLALNKCDGREVYWNWAKSTSAYLAEKLLELEVFTILLRRFNGGSRDPAESYVRSLLWFDAPITLFSRQVVIPELSRQLSVVSGETGEVKVTKTRYSIIWPKIPLGVYESVRYSKDLRRECIPGENPFAEEMFDSWWAGERLRQDR